MDTTPRIAFFHAPQSRSAGTRALLEELGVDHGLHVLGLKAGDLRGPDCLAGNPRGKLSAIRACVDRVLARPAMRRAAAKDAGPAVARAG